MVGNPDRTPVGPRQGLWESREKGWRRLASQPTATTNVAFRVSKTGDLGHPRRLDNGDHDFAANVAGLDVAHSLCSFAQRIGTVDNWNHCASLG